jgi:acyl-coenzyme A thioesterase PaaI-like protein
VRAGQLAQARAQVVRRTGTLVFMRGEVAVEGSPVLAAQALMKVLAP